LLRILMHGYVDVALLGQLFFADAAEQPYLAQPQITAAVKSAEHPQRRLRRRPAATGDVIAKLRREEPREIDVLEKPAAAVDRVPIVLHVAERLRSRAEFGDMLLGTLLHRRRCGA